ncbi:hypothetical protein MKZ08_10615 [Viridibacillus sp. FSL R5-0477]|uniref:Uncharacterized protein n=1 Tax=Viridibacillus arenosi FSL R5-213 TaxID=1227360 RepID=W4F3E9_9BACL|nr:MULTISPECIES: hypothetical protein [Viridibacillus]ETT86561.1 hypothetical protein C176_07602 [Viridibacillus arenosi FSL R5-213]OMC84564.1 hypothetical protein BK130_02775 [Viridibacillus sp. FSL H8-0123]OMC85984.1 hypothetical protein BK128_13210 [Viridibacillus sp. FSL H7-0596]OMC91613.1 hypothetical protein BK137_06735 [Viridibacillus arenosi]
MSLFNIKHTEGIHSITDVKKHKNNIELHTVTGEELYIVAFSDETYTVYDDRFAGASKQMNSIEAYEIDGSFRNLDFDAMRSLFSNSFDRLMDELSTYVGSNKLVNLDDVKEEITKEIKGIHFKIITDTKKYQY